MSTSVNNRPVKKSQRWTRWVQMVTLVIGVFALLSLIPGVLPQQPEVPSHPAPGHGTEAEHEGDHHGPDLTLWKWANFLILAGIIGFFAKKAGGPFFAGRTRDIQKDIAAATQLKQDADARYAAMEERLAKLDTEVAALRAQGRQESEGEAARVARETEEQLRKVRLHAEQDIASAGKAARQELRAYAANVAIDLAQQKVRHAMSPEQDRDLVSSFLVNLEKKKPAQPQA
jgi:F-type H+-transporting ATPase subunit b